MKIGAATKNYSFSSYVIVDPGENFSLYHQPHNLFSSKEHHPSEIITSPHDTDHGEPSQLQECIASIPSTNYKKLGHHNYVRDTTSTCISRKQLYSRLCANSMYDVFKFSYDDENYLQKPSLRNTKALDRDSMSPNSNDGDSILDSTSTKVNHPRGILHCSD